ncbi:hypothetical protein ACTU3I_15200 [Microbacterium sp. RD1]|uniref:hypothetical protein n=1 Tax=Microbacterium sp. RD1 TaxID=3457313 RepID=UPI003FA55F8D
MQILLGIILGAVVGLAVHYVAPQRLTRGVALAPLVGAASAAVAWTVLTWLGLAVDNPLLWLAALVVPAVVTIPVVFSLAASRARRDADARARLRVR